LAQVLSRVPRYQNSKVLVGYETADDAGVYRLDAEHALVQTVDFFTPVVDDPYFYGAIAAANSLSDVYAMGGTPITAMAIACFPEKGGDMELLSRIMTGGVDKLHEADVALVGGHTVVDTEIKFGYSVTGLIHPDRVITNSRARAGDALVLTKPLGLGILTSGIKSGRTSAECAARVTEIMAALNRAASEVMIRHDCSAATDITGNGLLGHAFEMAEASRITLRFHSNRIPFIPEAVELAREGVLPRTIKTTWSLVGASTECSPAVNEALRNILLDPQTSGGLLICVKIEDLPGLMRDMSDRNVSAAHVGSVEEYCGKRIVVE
jgi:selenide,water dikinase